MPEIVD
jgi:hypothetical protein